jgi:predicted RNase H-like nuclease
MNVVGIDGCKYGWISVNLKEDLFWKVKLFSNIEELLDYYKSSDLILIDMPLGLLDESKEERICDKEIRKVLGYPRGMSVFGVPSRSAIYCDSYKEGNALNKKLMNKGISKQLWGIAPKIKRLDQYLIKNKILGKKIFESHPELAFMMLNGKSMNHNKRTKEGYTERFELLKKIYPKTDEIVNHTLENYLRKEVKKDDILDALVLAINAYLGKKLNFKNYPELKVYDEKGFQMVVKVLEYDEIKDMGYKEIRSIFK